MTIGAPLRRLRRGGRQVLVRDIVLVMIANLIITTLVKLAWPGFAFWGDNADSFFPLWHIYGEHLRAGQLYLFDHNGWGAANVVGEAAYGLFNPVTAINAVGISLTENLQLAAFVVMGEHLAFLAGGVYMLARVYGAGRSASLIVGIIVPFSGFTLFYEAGDWASGLMSVTWVVHFWWSARAYTSNRTGPILAVLFGGLAATVGNPYSVLGILMVLFGLAVELVARRDVRRLGGLVVVGTVVGSVVLFVYLPLFGNLARVNRGATFSNDNYLTPGLGDLFGMSSPTYLTRTNAWNAHNDLVPSSYLSWLILPLLPWLRWGGVSAWKSRVGLIATTLAFLLLTLGPGQFWLFHWPIRLIEYCYVGVAVLFAVILSAGLTTTHLRRRAMISGVAALVVTFFVSWASTPPSVLVHLTAAVVVTILTALVLLAYRRFVLRGVVVVVFVGTALVAPLQAQRYDWSSQPVAADIDQAVQPHLDRVRAESTGFRGTVLQIAEIFQSAGTDAVYSAQLNFGNTAAAAGITSMNRYTGLNFVAFQTKLRMDYRGSVDPAFRLKTLFAPASATVDVPLVDAMGVDTLVVASTRPDYDELTTLARGWHVVSSSNVRTVMERNHPLRGHVTVQRGAAVQHQRNVGQNGLAFDYQSSASTTVTLDRLAWNGYSATVNGRSVETRVGPAGLLQVRLPAGSGAVRVEYHVPGLVAGTVIIGIGLLVALVHQVFWLRRWRRRHRSWSPEVFDPYEEALAAAPVPGPAESLPE